MKLECGLTYFDVFQVKNICCFKLCHYEFIVLFDVFLDVSVARRS